MVPPSRSERSRPVASAQGRRRLAAAPPPAPARAGSRRRPKAAPRRRRGPLARLVPWKGLLALAAAGSLLWLSRSWLLTPVPPPQLILVLGGDVDRERLAARLASADGLPVVVSGGSNPEYARWLFQRQGIDRHQVQLDYRAHDTLTNFTSLVDELKQAQVRHVLLVTSSDHMDRALLIGRIVAGSRGIALTPVSVPCGDRCHAEEIGKVWGDGVRAMVWVVTGRDLRGWLDGQQAPARGAGGPDRAGH